MDRWERRARKDEAKRRRMRKRGLGYVRLVEQMLKKRARDAKMATDDV